MKRRVKVLVQVTVTVDADEPKAIGRRIVVEALARSRLSLGWSILDTTVEAE